MWGRCWIVLVVALGAALPVNAQWQLIDDFQQWEDHDIVTDATEIGWHGYSPMDFDEYWFIEYPQDSGNISLYMGTVSEEGMWAMKRLPDGGIGVGETGTLYFHYMTIDSDSNLFLGTADSRLLVDEETGDPEDTVGWNDFNALIRLEDATLAHWDGEDFVATNPAFQFEELAWYECWIVIRNTFEETDGTWSSTGGYTVYLK